MDAFDVFYNLLMIAILFGLPILKRVAKKARQSQVAAPSQAEENQADSFDDLSDSPLQMEEDEEYKMSDVYDYETEVESTPYSFQDKMDELLEQAQNLEEQLRKAQAAASTAKADSVATKAYETVNVDNNHSAVSEPFDLKKAIIYQTIMENNYIHSTL